MNAISSESDSDMLTDDDVVMGITVPADNKGNPMPAIAIGTIPLCIIGSGIIAVNISVSAIMNFGIVELSGIEVIEPKVATTDTFTKSKSKTLNKLTATRSTSFERSHWRMDSCKGVILQRTNLSWA